jgi:predicted ATPase/DNA-binding winged helix-turn-helix (wHTH) protein
MSSGTALAIVSRDQAVGEGAAPLAPTTRVAEAQSDATSIHFGAFYLWPLRRLLMLDNRPVPIGSRALEILIALVEQPGALVTKQELMARVWPNTFVEPANLTVHIAALRRALGDGRDGNRFLINIPGRGYRFVAPVIVLDQFKPSLRETSSAGQSQNLPARVTRLIGRNDIVARLSAQITRDRVISVVGPGGIGKTAVALSVAEEAAGSFRHGAWWIDLAGAENAEHVVAGVASVLGLESGREALSTNLVTVLRNKEILLVLDSCEHVVAAVASLVAAILREGPGVHVLATSREPLHTQGEQLCRLAGLQSPPVHCASAEQALRFPAVELFVERATASVATFAFDDADAAALSEICSTLDGFPLAIELAARRVGSLGIAQLSAGLGQPQVLLTAGYRTGPPRQRTMRASLDWSYDLLTNKQQIALRRLAVFQGEFGLYDAARVVSDQVLPELDAVDQIAELVAKSLITSEMKAAQPRFRLTNVTRAYALEKLRESGELDATARLVECLKANVKRVSAVDTLSGPLSAVTSPSRLHSFPSTIASAQTHRRSNYHRPAETSEGSQRNSGET